VSLVAGGLLALAVIVTAPRAVPPPLPQAAPGGVIAPVPAPDRITSAPLPMPPRAEEPPGNHILPAAVLLRF
jgi:hypothetical protein